MTTRFYQSTDASAPALTGEAGSLVAMLSAVLVDGYGAIPGAGWTKPFTGTNSAAFRNSTSTGTGFYLQIDDNAQVTACSARARGYESMTGITTGSYPFPTSDQFSNGFFIRKSATQDTTARKWLIAADETVFYLFVESGDYTQPIRATVFSFGDFYSFKTNDAYRCMIVGRYTEVESNPALISNCEDFPRLSLAVGISMMQTTSPAHIIARGVSGTGGPILFGVHGDVAASGINVNPDLYPPMMGQSNNNTNKPGILGLVYPNPADGGVYMAPAFIHHNGGLRGYFKGIWIPSQDMPLGHKDTFSGSGAIAAKQFIAIQMLSNSMPGECFVEKSDTWS